MQITTPVFVNQLIQKFTKKNFEIYIVGGAVRDVLMGKIPTDWDFTTNATPEQTLKLFPNGFCDNRFGTVGIVNPKDKLKQKSKFSIYEITTFRKEYGYSNKRHPDKIKWGETLKEDLKRRDFTINAIALKSTQNTKIKTQKHQLTSEYQLIDLFSGQSDLKNKLIRAVGNPQERFQEDALRMMRAVRIAAQLGFIIESQTLLALQQNAILIKQIANERIRDELLKLLATQYSADGVTILANSGLLEYIIPELLDTQGVDQAGHHTEDVWRHSLLSLHHCPSSDPIVRLATLIHDIGKPYTRAYLCENCQTIFKQISKKLICPKCNYLNDYYKSVTFYNHEMAGAKIAQKLSTKIRLSQKQTNKLTTLVRWHMFSVDERQTNKAIRRFIKNVSKEYLQDILDLRTGDRLGGGARQTSWRYERFKKLLIEVQKQPFTIHDLNISGKEIMKLFNLQPSRKVGTILKQLYQQVIDKKLENKHSTLLKKLKQLAKEDST